MSEAKRKEERLPEEILLTEVEVLLGENISLRMQNAQRDLVELQREQDEFKSGVESRLKIDDLKRYIVNRKGKGVLVRKD